MNKIQGAFSIQLKPQAASGGVENANIGRQIFDKQFRGDLEATSQGEMLSCMGHVQGSAGYVAIERVTGNLQGKQGSFALMHMGTMTRGEKGLKIHVIPDSGTDQLQGLQGSMDIQILDGQHFYNFEFRFEGE
jgi:hypothetical protein